MEYLFLICQYMDGDNAVMRRVEVVKEITICNGNIQCSSGFQVVFNKTKSAVNVRENECLYVTKDNKDELTFQE